MDITISDIYKLLPRSNCGECGYPSCYSFALNVLLKGENINRCPYLEKAPEVIAKLKEKGELKGRKLWEEPLKVLREKTRGLDFKKKAGIVGGKYGTDGRGEFMLMEYMGKKLKVYRDDVLTEGNESIDPWIKVLIFNYILRGGRETGKWVDFSGLPMGMIKYKSFKETVEKPLAEILSEKPDKIHRLKETLKAESPRMGDEDISLLFRALPKVPILLLFWKKDEEEGFPARVRVLFDSSCGEFLDIESTMFLGEELVKLAKSL